VQKKPTQKRAVEWLKVKALSSNSNTEKKKEESTILTINIGFSSELPGSQVKKGD
jgi:hypothetical protein